MAHARTTPAPGTQAPRPRDISRYAEGNAGIPYALTFDSGETGPHVAIFGLIHGNELCGAAALDTLITCGLQPAAGRVSLVFANVDAYKTFDPTRPFASRYIDEDMNRLWSPDLLRRSTGSRELARAQALRPLVETVDYLLDLHSTSSPSPPMCLAGRHAKGIALARKMRFPGHVVSDAGHAAGPRLRDFGAFDDPARDAAAVLVECGEHFSPQGEDFALAAAVRFLLATGSISSAPSALAAPVETGEQRFVKVSEAVTIRTDGFRFVRPFRCFETIAAAGTTIAHDGAQAVVTPYDDCVLVLPARHSTPGQTAVRLGRRVDWPVA